MGSFNATCIVSGLAIEAGDRVRYLALTQNQTNDVNGHACYVSGRWQVRCPPLRAHYNDYGGIEHIKKRFINRVFFESFDIDCVEKGVGDNQCHDVQVRPGMKRKDWLEALWEGRVEVQDHRDNRCKRTSAEPENPRKYDSDRKPGMPSLDRIERVLKDAGHPIVTSYAAAGYFVDEPSYGFIRVRHGRDTRGEKVPELEMIVPLMQAAGYAAMLTCGTGTYRNYAEVLVAPLPGPEINFVQGLAPRDDRNGPRPVSLAMIREDVWQILLQTPIHHWRGDFTFEKLQADARTALGQLLAHRAKLAAFAALPTEEKNAKYEEHFSDDFTFRYTVREGGENLFWGALRPGEGNYGWNLSKSLDFALDLNPTEAELENFLQDMAETIYVEWNYSLLHGQWHPTTNSGQDGNWKAHRAFLRKLVKIKGKYENDR